MRLAVLSDTHGEIVKVPHCDIVIHCGDALLHSSPKQYNFIKELAFINKCFAPWVDRILSSGADFLYVPGNHCAIFENDFHLLPEIIKERTLINRAIVLRGLRIYGTPYQPYFYGWHFNKQDIPDSLGQIYSLIPGDTDVLATHCPPYGILDQNEKGEHCGSRMLATRLKEISPQIHCFGHIHASPGIREIGGTTFINSSVMDDRYIVTRPPTILEIPDVQ